MKTALLSLPDGALGGNRTTALRWAKILRELGWDVVRAARRGVDEAQLIIALHAVHTSAEVERLAAENRSMREKSRSVLKAPRACTTASTAG